MDEIYNMGYTHDIEELGTPELNLVI